MLPILSLIVIEFMHDISKGKVSGGIEVYEFTVICLVLEMKLSEQCKNWPNLTYFCVLHANGNFLKVYQDK